MIIASRGVMTKKDSTMDVRARIGDMLDRVALRHDEFIIERRGRPLAALVPIDRLEQMRRFARQHGLAFIDRQKGAPGDQLSDEEAMRVALDAQRAARRGCVGRSPGRSAGGSSRWSALFSTPTFSSVRPSARAARQVRS